MRAAIIHYWLLNQRGGEKVLDGLCRLLPDADIFTLFCDRSMLSEEVARRRIIVSPLNRFRRWHRSLLPLMPMALESFDLRGYDLVVSSESGPAKGVITSSTAQHICYCHTPMRYLWDLYPAYRNEFTRSRLKRAVMAPLSNYLRLWDFASSARVDRFIANGANVQRRIWKTYRRESDVIHPPVDVDSFYTRPAGDYFLAVSELAPYKRIDLLVRYFSRTGRRLVIVGSGPDYRRLRASAGPNVEFAGRLGATALRSLYAGCRAFLMPGEEDFGIAPVEALASGKPVIALGRGGVLETVPSFGGEFFDEPTEAALSAALRRFEEREADFRAPELQSWAQQFSAVEFDRRMGAVIQEACHSPAPGRHSPIFR